MAGGGRAEPSRTRAPLRPGLTQLQVRAAPDSGVTEWEDRWEGWTAGVLGGGRGAVGGGGSGSAVLKWAWHIGLKMCEYLLISCDS